MTQMNPYQRGRRDGVRWAITWLHERAKEMNDPAAREILNTAAFHIGVANARDKSERAEKIIKVEPEQS